MILRKRKGELTAKSFHANGTTNTQDKLGGRIMSKKNEKDELKNSDKETLQTETPNGGDQEHEAIESLTDEVVEEPTPDTVSDADEKPGEDEEATETLPEGVTPEPRSEEEMHLELIKHSPVLTQAYLAVSDDEGHLLGNQNLETRIKVFCERHKDVGQKPIKDPNKLLEEAKNLSLEYAPEINKSEKITAGVLAKYLIRLGILFNIQKILVRKSGLNWGEWYAANHTVMSLRSAQDYMALGKVPGIIRYAFFGKERLIELLRAIKGSKNADPVGEYLKEHGIMFDPLSESVKLTEQTKAEVDTVIAMIRISNVEEKVEVQLGVKLDLIKNLVEQGIRVEGGMIRDMVIVAQNGGDVDQYLSRRFMQGGAEEPVVISTKKLQSIPKAVATFKGAVDHIKENPELVTQVNTRQIEALESHISELRALVTNE